MMKVFSFRMCLFKDIQHSVPYNKIDSTQTWYTFLLVFKAKFLKPQKLGILLLFVSQHLHPSYQKQLSEIQGMEISQHNINHHPPLEVCDRLSRYLRISRYLFNIEIKIIGFIIKILVFFCILLCTTLNI